MAEVWICWLLLAVFRGRRALGLRKPAHAKRRGSLSVDAVLDNRYAETVHEIVEEYRHTGEIDRVVDEDDFVTWSAELGVATARARYAHEVAPICAQLSEPAPFDESILDFTGSWRRTETGFEWAELYAGSAR